MSKWEIETTLGKLGPIASTFRCEKKGCAGLQEFVQTNKDGITDPQKSWYSCNAQGCPFKNISPNTPVTVTLKNLPVK